MPDDKHPPKDDHAHAPPPGKPKKELPWGLPAFIFFLTLAIGYGISFMAGSLYSERNAIDWLISTFYRLLGPALILAIAAALIRERAKKS